MITWYNSYTYYNINKYLLIFYPQSKKLCLPLKVRNIALFWGVGGRGATWTEIPRECMKTNEGDGRGTVETVPGAAQLVN